MAKKPSKAQRERAHAQDQAIIYGGVLLVWSHLELVMEMIIQRELRLNLEETCIVCAPLGGGAKVALMTALLNRNIENAAVIEAFKEVQSFVGRNALVHGFVLDNSEPTPWTVISREVRTSLKVRHRSFDHYDEEEFFKKVTSLLELTGISDDDLGKFGLEIAALGSVA